MIAIRDPNWRLIALVKEGPGLLHRLTKAIDEAGGINLALSIFASQRSEDREVTLKINALDEKTLREVLQPLVIEIKDLHEINF